MGTSQKVAFSEDEIRPEYGLKDEVIVRRRFYVSVRGATPSCWSLIMIEMGP